MSTTFVRPLADIRAADVAFGGGKAANLGELAAAGLAVPDAFVIGVPAYVTAAADGPVAAPSGDLRDAIVAHYRAMGHDVAVAVRSSAVAEDGATASHAGIFETVLNVKGVADLLDAVRRCWASATSPRARRYTGVRGLESDGAGIAVVVQRQIASACSGVVFTADPLTGSSDRLVLECVRGLGEAVVAGQVTPDRIVVDKQSLDIVAVERGNQESTLEGDCTATGLVSRSLTAREAVCPSLSESQIREIARHALRIEQWYGSPQDIEWAFDGQTRSWILQTRPITAFDMLAARATAFGFYDPLRSNGSRWTRANIAEAVPGVPTPLTWSVWSAGLNDGHRQSQIQLGVVAKGDHRRVPVVNLVRGWPALSVDLLVSQVAQIPGMDPSAFSEQFFGEAELVEPAPARVRTATALRMVGRAPINLALLQWRLRAVSETSRQAWQRDAWAPVVDPVALVAEAAQRFGETMVVHSMQTNVCQNLYQAVERIAGGRAIDLVSADGDLPEAHLATDLWLLAHGQISLELFLHRHGFHGPDEGELAAPSWRQNPEPVLHAARGMAGRGAARDPLAALDKRRAQRREAEMRLGASLPRSRRRIAVHLIAMARRAVVGRETGKVAFLQDLDVIRHAIAFLGDDAVWHTLDELKSKVALTATDVVARQRVRSQFAAQEPPLSIIEGRGVPESVGDQRSESTIAGIAASPGRARGRARVVTSPAANTVLGGGDVLIARTTDPSWVTTFMTVAGMVLDVGATMSHAAIIARELGIPCVIGTGNGTQVIPDGALVEIDGSQGTVRILELPT
ncbi:PEP/pyruvate-binding domain-containing protein [[Mycobacterium] vasticus]|uniref:PEP/pyruvate-binding domain-containing protein n=1 Tax=[Mycobacterium] vasticus TaxID=2875777 RepID=A0ABU5YZA9_9MYCO|nr:PEP/pyruvate-binding domain-containing protein [Mycolicibacter sp. MYC017]MEB3070479.1 PEP/pyruvate-binding domain-containing protein [Mycolicibacter sp. MYC017]